MAPRKKFSHRRNTDGTVDSVCHKCFATIAKERNESDLELKESAHHCNPWLVEWYHRPAHKIEKRT